MSNPITDQEIARLEELPVCPPTCDNLQCRLLARIRSDAETISKLRDERDRYREAFLNKQTLLTSKAAIDKVPEEQRPEPTPVPPGGSQQSR